MTATKRAAARKTAMDAVNVWAEEVFADLITLTVTERRNEVNPVIVFTGLTRVSGSDDTEAPLEELAGVIVADPSGKTLMTRRSTSPSRWAEFVELWADTRDMLTLVAGYPAEVSVVVDLAGRAMAAYESGYCPDETDGPEADLVFEFAAQADPAKDEFDQFLSDLVAEENADDPEDRIVALLAQYGINPPGIPEHEKGACPFHSPGSN